MRTRLVYLAAALILGTLLLAGRIGPALQAAPAGPTGCGPGAWTTQAPLPQAVVGPAAVALGGAVYSFGGWGANGTVANSYRYDPAANTWTPIAPLPVPLGLGAAVTDGTYIYLVNGSTNVPTPVAALYRYDPVTDSYTTLAAPPQATLTHAAVYLGGEIYRIGGQLASGGTDSVDVYDVAMDTWAPVDTAAAYPQAVWGLAAVGDGGYIYAAGGFAPPFTALDKTYRYDPVANTWDDAAVSDLPSVRGVAASGVLGGQWILAGGTADESSAFDTVVVLDLADPTGAWTDLPAMPVGRMYATGAAGADRFYALAGADATPAAQADNQQYFPCGLPASPTPTATPVPPTVTATPPAGAPPSATAPVPPSATATPAPPATATATAPAATATAGPSATAPPAATATPQPSASGTPAPSETPCALSFSDVPPSDYFYGPVLYLACHGVVSGYADGTFRPYTNTTRGQLAKIVVLAAGWPIDTSGGPHFGDVPASNPFYGVIETAYHHGVISGYADGTFRWGADVTRAQLCKIVVLAQGWALDTSGGPHFTDVPPTNPFYGVIETAYHHGIISGYAGGSFRWGADATRGQIAKIVYLAVSPAAP